MSGPFGVQISVSSGASHLSDDFPIQRKDAKEREGRQGWIVTELREDPACFA